MFSVHASTAIFWRVSLRDPSAEELHRQVIERGDHLFSQLHMVDVPCAPGNLAIEVEVRPELSNSRGAFQGGLIGVLADVAAGRLSLTRLPDGYGTATADMNVHYLAPIMVGPARAEASILRHGARTMVTQVEIRDVGADRLAAVSTLTFAILAPRPTP